MLFLTFAVAGKCASSERISRGKWKHPTLPFGFAGWCGSRSWVRSTANAFADLGKPIAGVGKAVEVVLALAAAVYDSPVPQQGQVVAQSRLAYVELVAHPPDMVLPFGEQGDDLESGRVAEIRSFTLPPDSGFSSHAMRS